MPKYFLHTIKRIDSKNILFKDKQLHIFYSYDYSFIVKTSMLTIVKIANISHKSYPYISKNTMFLAIKDVAYISLYIYV